MSKYHATNKPKYPGELLDYSFDWSDEIEVGETILTSNWTIPAGSTLVEEAKGISVGVVTVWLSGGTAGNDDIVENTITTATRTYVGKLTINIM